MTIEFEEAVPPGRRRGFSALVAQLTTINLGIVALAFVTSPILSRVLGPSGRGKVAAVFAVVSLAPWISEFGVTAFLSRERARRSTPLGTLVGSIIPVALAGSCLGVVLAVPLAHLMGRGRVQVVEMIELGLFLLPLSVFTGTLSGLALGEQRWGRLIAARLISAVGPAAAIVVLAATSHLSVVSACVTYIAAGIASNVPLLLSLRGSRPWRFSPSVTRAGLKFGARSWISTIAGVGNAQLDQLLMAGLVTSRQLGLYALAVTISTATSSLMSGATSALFPRVAAGEALLAARSTRVALALVAVFAVSVGATSPIWVPLVFGPAFTPMIPMLIILLAASLCFVPGQLLGQALIASGHPSYTARAQVTGLMITVPGLILLLPLAGGVGAAIVSLVAYATTLAIVLLAARRIFSLPFATMLCVTRNDFRLVGSKLLRRPA